MRHFEPSTTEGTCASQVSRPPIRRRAPLQAGFGTSAVLLVVVLIAAIGAFFAYSTRGSNVTSAQSTNSIGATTIIDQGTQMRAGFESMLARGSAASQVTFDTAATTGLFNPTTGGTGDQPPPLRNMTDEAIAGSAPFSAAVSNYSYKVAVTGPLNVGTAVGLKYGVFLPGVKLAVCQAINNQLYSDALSATPVASGLAATAFVGVAAVNLTGGAMATGLSQRSEGCIGTTDANQYVYFKIVYVQ